MDYPAQTEQLDATRPEDLQRAAAILRAGGLVAFPTETVYGLGANALDAEAVEKIFRAKQRPSWDPLIVHISSTEMLAQLTTLELESPGDRTQEPYSSVSPVLRNARTLIQHFWPGPLTLLLPRTGRVPDAVTAGRPLVGLRMPVHPVARRLIELAGVPIAAPSANRFGHVSPTMAAHVLADLDGRIDAVLDGGPAALGLESTVAEPTWDGAIVYRQGAVSEQMIRDALGRSFVRVFDPPALAATPESLPSPGVGIRHYAPKAQLILVEIPQDFPEGFDLLVDRHAVEGGLIGVMLPTSWSAPTAAATFDWGAWDDPEALARNLYAGLRALDLLEVKTIVCPVPRGAGTAAAIRDRLRKAARTA